MPATTFNVPLYTEGSKFQGPNISVNHVGGQETPITADALRAAFGPIGVVTSPTVIAGVSHARAQESAAQAQASAAELSAKQASAAQASAAEASAAKASAAQTPATVDPFVALLSEAENAGKLASAAQASAAEASAALEADSGAKQTASAALFTASAAQEAALHQYEKEHMLDILFELLVKPKFINNTILLDQNKPLPEQVPAVGGADVAVPVGRATADWSFKTDTSGNTVLVDANGVTRGVYEYASGASGDPSARSLQTWTTHRDFESSGAEKNFYANNPSGAIYLRDPRADDKVFIPNPFSTTSVPGRIPFNIPFKDHIMNMDQKLNSIMINLKFLSNTVMSMQGTPAPPEEVVEEEAVEEEAPEDVVPEEELLEEEPAVGGRKRKTRRKRRSA